MLLSQCIQKFCFNCFFPPVVHGLKQYCYCPVHLFSIPGNAPHCICVSQSTSRVLRAYLDKICLLYEVMASNCQTLLLLTYLSSSSCSVSRLSAAKGREVPVEWAVRSCTWENHKIRNDKKGQLDMSPSSQWRLSRDECKEASGTRQTMACFQLWARSAFKIAPWKHTGMTEGQVEQRILLTLM